MKVLIKFVWFYRGDIWRLVPEMKKSFFLLCDVIITLLVLGPATRWSIEISLPTVAMAVSSLDLEALCSNRSRLSSRYNNQIFVVSTNVYLVNHYSRKIHISVMSYTNSVHMIKINMGILFGTQKMGQPLWLCCFFTIVLQLVEKFLFWTVMQLHFIVGVMWPDSKKL